MRARTFQGALSHRNRLRTALVASLSFNFLSSTALASPQGVPLNFSRGTGATQYYSDGYLDYAPENLIRGSNNFSNATYWAASGFIVTDNAAFNPATGAFDAAIMLENGTGIHQNGTSGIPFSLQVGEYITIEVDMCSIGGRAGYLGSNSGVFGAEEYAYFDLSNGAVGSKGTNVYAAATSYLGLDDLGRPWYRCRSTIRATIGGGTPSFFVLAAQTPTGGRAPSYAGDPTKGIAVGRMNVRRGIHFGTYLATTAAAAYGPAFDYNPATTVFNGQNLFTYSSDITNASWTKAASSVVAAPNIAVPAGYSPAYKLNDTATNAQHYIVQNVTTTGGNFVKEILVQAAEYSRFEFRGVQGYDVTVNFNLNTQAVSVAGTNAATTTATITPKGNGFYLLSVKGLTNSGTLQTFFRLVNDANQSTFTGTGTSGVYISSPIVALGAAIPSYVETSAAALQGFPSASPRGLAIWEARTNLIAWAQTYTSSYWLKQDTTVAADTPETLSPAGLFNATKVVEGSANTALLAADPGTFTAGNRLIYSKMVKRGNHDWFRIGIGGDSTFNDRIFAWFNLATGAKGQVIGVGTGAVSDSGMIPIGGGWYICWVDGIVGGTYTSCRTMSCSATADGSGTRVSGAIRYEYGTQLESITPAVAAASTGRVTSYIPTYNGTIARGADLPFISVSPQTWYNQAEGTVTSSFEVSYINSNGLARGMIYNAQAPGNDLIRAFSSVGNIGFLSSQVAGTDQASFATPVLGAGNIYKTAYAYKVNDFQGYLNGSSLGVDTSGTVSSQALTDFRLGNRAVDFINGWVRGISWYRNRLSAAVMQGLTQ